MPVKDNVQIAPAEGKLGVLIPGIGAVSTTFIAGVEAIKRGLGLPVGSLTQLSTVRLGKRTDGRSPKVKEFVPLAGLDDLVFTGWDPFDDDMYTAARKAGNPDNSGDAGQTGNSPGTRNGARRSRSQAATRHAARHIRDLRDEQRIVHRAPLP